MARSARGEPDEPLSSAPEIDQKNHEKRGQAQPRDHDDFDPQFPNGGNVVVHIRILVKESVAIAKDVRASHQIDKEEECRSDSKRRKNGGIDKCQHKISGVVVRPTCSQVSKDRCCRKSSDF
jgi:hypothetical protein